MSTRILGRLENSIIIYISVPYIVIYVTFFIILRFYNLKRCGKTQLILHIC